MKITPIDIRHKEFKRAMRGYSEEEVDIFLDEVADDFELVFKENIELQDEVHRLKEKVAQYDTLKETLQKTLVSAQQQADATQVNARKEAELVLRDAEIKARSIVAEAYSEKQKVQQSVVQLQQAEDDFRFKFKSLLEAHLNLLLEDEASDDRRKLRGAAAGQAGAPGVARAAEAVALAEDTAPHPGPSPEVTADVPEPVVPVVPQVLVPAEPDTDLAVSDRPAPAAAPAAVETPAPPSESARTLVFGAAESFMSSVQQPEAGGADIVPPTKNAGTPEPSAPSRVDPRPSEPWPSASQRSTSEQPAVRPEPEPRPRGRNTDDLDFEMDLDAPLGGIDPRREDEEGHGRDQRGRKESSVRRFFFGSKGDDRGGSRSSDDRDFDW